MPLACDSMWNRARLMWAEKSYFHKQATLLKQTRTSEQGIPTYRHVVCCHLLQSPRRR